MKGVESISTWKDGCNIGFGQKDVPPPLSMFLTALPQQIIAFIHPPIPISPQQCQILLSNG
jgi:hypothetical protein